ncbi:hypothetical protein DPM33_35595 [Mesorhizobium hawassense]|uniref:Integrase catalytic domain-containing protein n=1 Tax=Mesorhizobium hawassense TaxID=1209954 RepID=A0A330H014_9HYPH|nr:hypothetical protein DPM33_35595 [Mesorhizobium hawassense]
MPIATSFVQVLRRPLESAQYMSKQFQRLVTDHGIKCSMSRSGNVWDCCDGELLLIARTRDATRADVFDYIERFYNPRRRHSTLDSQPHGVRGTSYVSLISCPKKRQQASRRNLSPAFATIFLKSRSILITIYRYGLFAEKTRAAA